MSYKSIFRTLLSPFRGELVGVFFLLALGIRAQVTISDITAGKYSPQSISALTPMADGESYSQLVDNKRIVRTSFKTGKDVATLFDVATVRGKVSVSSIDGYILSPDESRILIRPTPATSIAAPSRPTTTSTT